MAVENQHREPGIEQVEGKVEYSKSDIRPWKKIMLPGEQDQQDDRKQKAGELETHFGNHERLIVRNVSFRPGSRKRGPAGIGKK